MIIIRILIIVLGFSFIGCNSRQALSQEIKSKGVLIAGDTDQYELKSPIEVLDKDGKTFITIKKSENGEIVKSIKDSLEIRAFYPDYSIIIFDSKQTGDGYEVFINGSWRKLKSNKELNFLSWENFIEKIYLGLTSESPLHVIKDDTSKIIEGYKELYYEVIERDGDWLKVRCWEDCEGCPQGRIIEGWVRWRNKEQLLVDLYYIC